MVFYPSAEKIEEFNLLVLNLIKAKKSDQAKLASGSKLSAVINDCKQTEGDIFDKAVVLLKGVVQKHAFASGNRRTGFLAMKYFLVMNNQKTGVEDDPKNAKVLLGIRENYYSDAELKEWIKDGKIREFKR